MTRLDQIAERNCADSTDCLLLQIVRVQQEALERAQKFIDWTVRAWLPSEHTNCGIDSGCSHGVAERNMFQRLDDETDVLTQALARVAAMREGKG